ISNMSYCVTKSHFGGYSGGPYYPVVRYNEDGTGEQFAMIIPNFLLMDDREAIRNAQNNGRLSPSNRKKIESLIKKVIPDSHGANYAQKALYKKGLTIPKNPTSEQAFIIFRDYDLEQSDWPEGEDLI